MKSFYQEYTEAFRKYYFSTALYADDEKKITLVCSHYEKHGTRWTLTEQAEKLINAEYYFNIIDPRAVNFFKSLGGFERVICNYTKYGFIPVRVSSISPSRDAKTEYSFKF